MKPIYIIANWKSNKTATETEKWFTQIAALENNRKQRPSHHHIIVCVPFTLLHLSKDHVSREKLPYHIGAQNISPFPHGSYTGEIHGNQIKEFADYVIIGHSERRDLLRETKSHLQQKVMQAQQAGLKTVYCISTTEQYVPQGIDLIAFEPKSAIGTGNALDSEQAEKAAKKINTRFPTIPVIYGGSVTADNVTQFLSRPHIAGVLLGKSSLHSPDFFGLVLAAAKL